MNEIQNPYQPSNSHELITDCNTDKMKTAEDLIKTVIVNNANFEHIAKTGNINGTLYTELKRILDEFSQQQSCEFAEHLSRKGYEMIVATNRKLFWHKKYATPQEDSMFTTAELYQQWKGETK